MIADSYVRKVKVIRVIDGDTFEGAVDLGFTVTVTVRFRVKGIDTPEINSGTDIEKARGQAAKLRAEELLKASNNMIMIKSYKAAVYNRWEADVILADGTSLAEILIAEGHIKPVI